MWITSNQIARTIGGNCRLGCHLPGAVTSLQNNQSLNQEHVQHCFDRSAGLPAVEMLSSLMLSSLMLSSLMMALVGLPAFGPGRARRSPIFTSVSVDSLLRARRSSSKSTLPAPNPTVTPSCRRQLEIHQVLVWNIKPMLQESINYNHKNSQRTANSFIAIRWWLKRDASMMKRGQGTSQGSLWTSKSA